MWTFAQIQEKRRERKALYDQAVAISKAAEAEKRSLTAEENSKMDSMLDQVESMGKDIDRNERAFGLGQAMNDAQGSLTEFRAQAHQGQGQAQDVEMAGKHSKAFKRFLQVGLADLDPESRSLIQSTYRQQVEGRDLGVGTPAGGGYAVPQGFVAALEKAMKWYGCMLDVSSVLTTENGAPLPWPTVNDTGATGELLAENAAATTDASSPFGNKNFGAYIFSSKALPISIALLQDMAFDESILVDLLAERLGRVMNTYFTTGTGVSQPQGIVTGATAGKTGLVGQTLSVIYDDFVDLLHSVDPAYRNNPKAGWMMNDLSVGVLRKIKDTTGRPIWEPSIATDKPDTILGKPLYINNDIPVMAASAKSILFGDLSKYKIRRVREVNILRLTERFAEKLQVGFLGFVRADGAVLNGGTNPIKYYANSAT